VISPNALHRRLRSHALGVLMGGLVIVAGCAHDDEHAAPATSSSTTTAALASRCTVADASAPVTATVVAGSAHDHDLTSFDGTTIRFHWFPLPDATPTTPKPTVLMGPGWGQPGDSNPDGQGIQGILSIKSLNDAGFNVLTWDPRGFGKSTGNAEVDLPSAEGRDVQRLISWVSRQPEAQLDATGDPRMGMVGASYGGGIQLVTAAIDCRVDAIVPVIAWHSLVTSLGKAATFKQGWNSILVGVSKTGHLDPVITQSYDEGAATGTVSPERQAWYAARGPGDELVGKIHVPTLLIQGTVDTLFTLDEGVTNYRILRRNGVPVSMMWFCGGHGACFTNAGDPKRVERAALEWLRHFVRRDDGVRLGPRFDTVDQNGVRYTGDDLPTPSSHLTATGAGTLQLVAQGGSAPTAKAAASDVVGGISNDVMPGKASNAVNVVVPAPSKSTLLVGAPSVTLRYSGSVAPGERPERVFAQLVDDSTGLVIGNQVTPIPVTLDGSTHETTVPLEMISFDARPGSTVTLQLVATTVAYGQPRFGGSVTFQSAKVALPVVTGLHRG
jgi:ABC-2 type transport system ATP-binding protein